MIRTTLLAATMTLLSIHISNGQDAKALPRVEMVPDPTWKAMPGDRVQIFDASGRKCAGAVDVLAYTDLIRAAGTRDRKAFADLIVQGRVCLIADLTAVSIVEEYETALLAGGAPTLVLKVLDGELKGRTFWVMRAEVARLIPDRVEPAKPAQPALVATAPEAIPSERRAEIYRVARSATAEARNRAGGLHLSLRSRAMASGTETALTSVARRFGLTRDQLNEIIAEGRSRDGTADRARIKAKQ